LIDLIALESFDTIQWLGSGKEVSKRYLRNQSTVSRDCAKVKKLFKIDLIRINDELEINGDLEFINLERRVHQEARFMNLRHLRLEATYWSAPTLCKVLPSNWILGRSNIVGSRRNIHLVRDRIVDAWIGGLPDIPDRSDSELATIHISRMPIFLVCAPNHPLLRRTNIELKDIRVFPILSTPEGAYPKFEKSLKELGLWSNPVNMKRYKREFWEGKAEQDVVIGFATPLSFMVSGGSLCRLSYKLPIQSGDALIVRREFALHSRIEKLIEILSSNLKVYAQQSDEIEMLI